MCVFRCVYSAAVWYYDHLAGAMNVVMITEKQDTVAQYSCLNSGVFVITLQVQTGRRRQEFCTCNRASLYFSFTLIYADCTENCFRKLCKTSAPSLSSSVSEVPSPCLTGLLERLLASSAGGSGAARLHLPGAAGEGERRLAEGVCRTSACRGSGGWNQIRTLRQGAAT